jgi:hypothetical protein
MSAWTPAEVAAYVREHGRPPYLGPDHPLFAQTKDYPEAWRRAAFGDAAVDAEKPQREAALAEIEARDRTIAAQQQEIEELRKQLTTHKSEQGHRARDDRRPNR